MSALPTLPPAPDFPSPGFSFAGLQVAGRALMAPMMGYNEAPLRRICRRFGSGLAVTEMIKPEKLLRGDPLVLRDLEFGPDERPLGAQLAMREPEQLVPAAQQLAARGFDFLDLNLGCPLKKECRRGWGAALLRQPDEVARLIGAVVEAVSIPVTMKVRTGYELGEELAPAAVEAGIGAGAALVCVHGRTKMGWYREENSLPAIRRVCEQVAGRVPVVGNGDVTTLEAALRMFQETGCDALMIGRGAVGNPWIFRRIDHYLRRGEALPQPGLAEVRALYDEHMDAVQAIFGTRRGFAQVRRYAFYYFGRFGVGNAWRARVAQARDRDALGRVLAELEERSEAA